LEREPLLVLMAPSGVDKGRVKPQELIVVDGDGRVSHGSGRASAETLLHLAIVRETGAGAVLHTHSQAGTLLSQWSWELGGPQAAQIDAPGLLEDHVEDGVAYLEVRNLEMLKGIAGITTHQSEVQIPVLANDQDLGRLSRRAVPHLDRAPAGLLIAGHGLYAWGQDLTEARRHLEILEFLMEQRWRQLLLESLMERGLGSAPSQRGAMELKR
jgi:methylthioribulose-1-phosphate dehydratase